MDESSDGIAQADQATTDLYAGDYESAGGASKGGQTLLLFSNGRFQWDHDKQCTDTPDHKCSYLHEVGCWYARGTAAHANMFLTVDGGTLTDDDIPPNVVRAAPRVPHSYNASLSMDPKVPSAQPRLKFYQLGHDPFFDGGREYTYPSAERDSNCPYKEP
jgi:hypothetical protein